MNKYGKAGHSHCDDAPTPLANQRAPARIRASCARNAAPAALTFAIFLATTGTALAGPAEDAQAGKDAFGRGDWASALRLYRRAADQGNADAANSLGNMYFRGVGVPYDDTEAARWFRRAAELGDASAQRNMGNAHRFGQGVPKDEVQALVWFNLAAAQGNQGAAKRSGRSCADHDPRADSGGAEAD
jgi:TPR repeat protein